MKIRQDVVIKRLSGFSPSGAGTAFAVPRSGAEYQRHSRLYRAGKLRRLARGLYHEPQESRLVGQVPPGAESVAAAVADRTGEVLLPSESWAANLVGVSTQVPTKYVYWTTGTTRTRRIAGYEFQFKRGVPKRMVGAGTAIGLVLQAIRYLGPERAQAQGKRLLAAIPAAQHDVLRAASKQSVEWVAKVVARILAEAQDG